MEKVKDVEIIGVNEFIDQSFDQILDDRGTSYEFDELDGAYGNGTFTRYTYKFGGHDRVAYEETIPCCTDCVSSKVLVCGGRLADESPEAVHRAITKAIDEKRSRMAA